MARKTRSDPSSLGKAVTIWIDTKYTLVSETAQEILANQRTRFLWQTIPEGNRRFRIKNWYKDWCSVCFIFNGLIQQQTIPKFLNFTKCILSFSVVTAKMLTWTVQIRLLVLSDCSVYVNPTPGSLPVASTHPQWIHLTLRQVLPSPHYRHEAGVAETDNSGWLVGQLCTPPAGCRVHALASLPGNTESHN